MRLRVVRTVCLCSLVPLLTLDSHIAHRSYDIDGFPLEPAGGKVQARTERFFLRKTLALEAFTRMFCGLNKWVAPIAEELGTKLKLAASKASIEAVCHPAAVAFFHSRRHPRMQLPKTATLIR